MDLLIYYHYIIYLPSQYLYVIVCVYGFINLLSLYLPISSIFIGYCVCVHSFINLLSLL